MDSDEIKLLLVKHITNQANDAEALEVKQWIKLHPENELYYIELYEAWQNMLYTQPQIIDEETAYTLFTAKISPQQKSPTVTKWIAPLAAIIVLVAAGVWMFNSNQTTQSPARQIVAQKGAIKKIELEDGTSVWLNAGSTINYDKGFNKTNRTIYLEGEAFFDIAHPKNNVPFLVKTKNYTIRDIGTSFNLKAYPNDAFFETTVVKGEVSVETASTDAGYNVNRIYVKPHQVLKINYHSEKQDQKQKLNTGDQTFNEVQVLQVDSAKLDVYAGWKNNLLVFDGNTLGDIAKVLERRYNVTIAINNDELKQIRYSGSFLSVPSIDKVLMIIKQNTPINYTINANYITITKITDHLKKQTEKI